MLMDEQTKRVLDLERVLAELHPITAFGNKLKNQLQPFMPKQKQQLKDELDRVEKLKELVQTQKAVFVELRTTMKQLKDIRRSVERCRQGGVLSSVELFELKNLEFLTGSIARSQRQLHWIIPEKYKVTELEWLKLLLDPEHSGLKTFYIYDSYSKALTEIRTVKTAVEQQIDCLKKKTVKKLEEELKIPVRVYGELSVNRSNTELVKKLREHPQFRISGESFVNVSFKVNYSDEIMQKIKVLESLKGEEALEECKVMEELSKKISAKADEILRNMDAVGEFDLVIAKAYLAITQAAVKPVIIDDGSCNIKNGRHPLVELSLRKKGKLFKPVSISLNKGVTLITGANMGGKTVSLKMAGLFSVMVQYGLLVPAESMQTDLFDFVFISAGDEQSLDQGLSTFGAEMKNINEMLLHSKQHGLVLIDELARGTNPHEGYAISYAIIDFLLKSNCVSIITTHFDGLARPGIKHLQVRGLRDLDEGLIKTPELIAEHMDYTLMEMKDSKEVPRDAIKISKMMGIPDEIIKKAEEVMKV